MSHLLCLILPANTLLFLVSGPHCFTGALVWTLPLFGVLLADYFSPGLKSNCYGSIPGRYFDALLYALVMLQLANIIMMLILVSRLVWDSVDSVIVGLTHIIVIRFLVATSSCCSGIIVAHELIHRSSQWQRLLGKLLLISVCYEHFVIAHIHSHHRNVGQPQDITTAHLGESFKSYWQRVVVEQFVFAWQFDKNRVIRGLSIEFILIMTIIYGFGWLAAVMFVYQAYVAVRILEAVNYIQHWGLQDQSPEQPIAWVNDNWFTQKMFLGLPLQIDHHKNASKPFYQLSYGDRGPKMPYGYFIMNFWVKLDNASFRRMAGQSVRHSNRLAP